jgi:hypothetical protein
MDFIFLTMNRPPYSILIPLLGGLLASFILSQIASRVNGILDVFSPPESFFCRSSEKPVLSGAFSRRAFPPPASAGLPPAFLQKYFHLLFSVI